MQLNYLKYVIAIAEHGSLNKASQYLYVSQQHLSKVIHQLEKELGVTIFIRNQWGMTLTTQGEKILAFAQQYSRESKAIEQLIQIEYLKSVRGVVNIGSMKTGAAMIIPQILCKYYKSYPEISLNIDNGDSDEVIQMLKEHTVDIAIILRMFVHGQYYPKILDEFQVFTLAETTNCYWINKHSPLATKKILTMSDVVNYPLIFQAASDEALLRQLYHAFGGKANVVEKVDNPYLLGQLVADDCGILPDTAIDSDKWMQRYVFIDRPEVIAIPLDQNDYQAELCLLTYPSKENNLLINHTINFLKEGKWRN